VIKPDYCVRDRWTVDPEQLVLVSQAERCGLFTGHFTPSTGAQRFSTYDLLSQNNPGRAFNSLPFRVLTCVGWSWRFAAISWTVLSPRNTSSATADLSLSEKVRRIVIIISCHQCEYILARCSNLQYHFILFNSQVLMRAVSIAQF